MRACEECVVRGLLLASLAGHIDRVVDGRVGERARDLMALGDEALAKAVSPRGARSALASVRAVARRIELEEALRGNDCWSICAHHPVFPADLAVLGDARPRALFGAGDPALLEALTSDRAVTIVGSRRAGAYGREVARELARLLAGSGLVVISGLALGVDSEAHEGALAGGGETVAVLGTGPERAYPRSRRRLYESIRAGGLVISELPPGTPTFRWMFPARNRVMAALGGITVVVEAAERSGSLITAEMAIEAGRQVGAVPGPVTSWRSSGTNRLLADGAAVIRDARDVLDVLLGPGVAPVIESGPPIEARERAVLDAVEAGAASADSVAAAVREDYGRVLAALGRLERDGYLSSDATGRMYRTALSAPGGVALGMRVGGRSTMPG